MTGIQSEKELNQRKMMLFSDRAGRPQNPRGMLLDEAYAAERCRIRISAEFQSGIRRSYSVFSRRSSMVE